MTFQRAFALVTVSALLAGCAHTPPVTLGYYLPRSEVGFKVIETVACDAADNPIIATAATPTVKHHADFTTQHPLALPNLRGAFSDTDIKVEFYEDGRLSGINASSTGQGEAILKTAITIATAVLGFDGGPSAHPSECADIRSFGGGKPLTLTFEGEINLNSTTPQFLEPDVASTFYAQRLNAVLGGVCATVLGTAKPSAPATYTARPDDVLVTLRQPGTVHISLTAGPRSDCSKTTIWNDHVPIAQVGTDYVLPIPAAAMFGKQVFAVSIAESGALKSVQYASNTGAGQVLNVANAGLGAIAEDTAAEKASQVKAEADLIAQQQRLVACLADPTACK